MVFNDYSNLRYLNIPSDVVFQNDMYRLFYNNKNIRAVNAANNVVSSITNMSGSFYNCQNLTGSSLCGPNVVNMCNAYYKCINLKGSPLCGPNVIDMSYTYCDCVNLTGSPVCGENVVNMCNAYSSCYNLTGVAACGNNVQNLSSAYSGCSNIIAATCGPNVTKMYYAYSGCGNIRVAVCGPNVTNLAYAYINCRNISGNMYMYSSKVDVAGNCFSNRSTSNMLNIYVPANSTSLTSLLAGYSEWTMQDSIVGDYNCAWTNDTANNRYYNTQYNIYIYPVENVAASREVNGD